MIWKYLQNKFWNWGLLTTLVSTTMREQRNSTISDLCSRVSIDKMRKILDEAEKSGEKYTTLARLIEQNYDIK